MNAIFVTAITFAFARQYAKWENRRNSPLLLQQQQLSIGPIFLEITFAIVNEDGDVVVVVSHAMHLWNDQCILLTPRQSNVALQQRGLASPLAATKWRRRHWLCLRAKFCVCSTSTSLISTYTNSMVSCLPRSSFTTSGPGRYPQRDRRGLPLVLVPLNTST